MARKARRNAEAVQGKRSDAVLKEVERLEPDPVGHGSLFASLTFGPTNYISDSGISLAARDQRWAVYSTPYFGLAPSGSYAATFDVEIPTTIPASGYQGGAFLWKGNYFGIGTLFQRALLDFVVT
jgi:hypothetical protein